VRNLEEEGRINLHKQVLMNQGQMLSTVLFYLRGGMVIPSFHGLLLRFPRFCGSSAPFVLSNCVDRAPNQCRWALEDISPKKSTLTHSVGVRCLSRPTLATFSLLLSTRNAEEPQYWGLLINHPFSLL
jgi:hypothetical protein